MCESLVISSSVKEVEIVASRVTVESCEMYNYVVFFYPFMTTIAHRLTFKTPPLSVYI